LPAFDLVLPLVDIKDELPTKGNPYTDLEGCTYALHDADHALRHSYYLLTLLVHVSSSAAGTYEATPLFKGYLAWILDGFLLLREVERAWALSSAAQQSAIETCILSVRAVHSLLISMAGLLPTSLTCKGYSVLARLCTELCDYPDALSETLAEVAFCTTLLDLAANCVHHEPVAQAVRFQLLPALQDYQDSQPQSESQSSDTIVCTSHFLLKAILTMVQKCIAILRDECTMQSGHGESGLSGPTNFDSSCLVNQLRHLALANNHGVVPDGTHPAKRRKTAPEQDVLNEVVREAYLLLGSQSASDLDGLRHVVGYV
jgi:hypothetical protein